MFSRAMFTRCFKLDGARIHLLVLAGYLLLTLLMTFPLVAHFGECIPGDGFDGWQNYWNMWWVKTALLDLHQSPYFTQYLYYPTGTSLLFQTLNIFNSLVTLPIQLAFGLTVSYNFVVLFAFVVGGYGAYLLALRVIGTERGAVDHLAAFLAGVVFTFSPFHFAHLLGHMQVISLEWLPFYALCLLGSLSSPRLRVVPHVGLPVLFLVLTALCDWYYLLYLLIFTLAYVFYVLWRRRSPRLSLLKAVAVVAVAGLILSPLLVPMVAQALRDPSHLDFPLQTTVRLSADLQSFVTPNEFHPIWGPAASQLGQVFTSSTAERMVFAGYIPLALAGYALWSRKREAAFWLASGLLFFVLALGPYLHVAGRQLPIPLPFLALYRFVPFFRIARSVSRFDVMVMLSLAILAALGLQAVVRRLPGGRSTVFALVVVGLVCFEFLPVPYPLSRAEVPSFYRSLAADQAEYAILELPMDWDRPAHLLYQTVHHKPIVAGYVTRPNPLSLAERVPVLQQFRFLGPDIIAQDPAEVAPEVLRFLGVRYVILHDYMLAPGEEREATLDLVDEVFAGLSPAYDDGWITVLEVGGEEADSPFLMLGEGWGRRRWWRGKPARALGTEASLTLVAPVDTETTLTFSAVSEESTRSLEVSLNGESLGTYEIGPQRADFQTPTLLLNGGLNTAELVDQSGGEPAILVTSLGLSSD